MVFEPGGALAWIGDGLLAQLVAGEEDDHHEGEDDHPGRREQVEEERALEVVAGSEPM